MPAVPLTMRFQLQVANSDTEYHTIDLSQCVSIMSRRFFRQGLEWAVAGMRIQSNQACAIDVATLPSNWSCANAWVACYESWRQLNRDAQETAPGTRAARYSDFKIFMDEDHIGTGFQPAPNLLPYQALSPGAADTVYEWDYTEINFPEDSDYAGAKRMMHMLGDDGAQSLGMIHGYADSRSRPVQEDPNVPEGGGKSWLTALFDTGDNYDPTLSDLSLDNSAPPYYVGLDTTEEEYYPGGKNFQHHWTNWLVSKNQVYNSAAGTLCNGFVPGFVAPCGLVRLQVTNNSLTNNDISIFLDLVPGQSHGYMTRPMLEMN